MREVRGFQSRTKLEAMGTNWNTGGSLWTSGNTFLLQGRPSTGTGCPESLWSLCA